MQASALLSEFMAAGKMDSADIHGPGPLQRRDGAAGPSAHPYLGRAADVEELRRADPARHARQLRLRADEGPPGISSCGTRRWHSGCGGRSPSSSSSARAASIRTRSEAWVRQLIGDSEELRKSSLYAGSSLDLELAITVPAAWSPPGDDWVGEALLTRARNGEATIRERGTAVMGLVAARDRRGPARPGKDRERTCAS